MQYDLSHLNERKVYELKNKLVDVFLHEVYPSELVNIYLEYIYSEKNHHLTEIMPNEPEYLDEYFEGHSAWDILGHINTEEITYRRDDDYVTVDHGKLMSMNGLEVKDYLEEKEYLGKMAMYLIQETSDFGIDAIGKVMEQYEKK